MSWKEWGARMKKHMREAQITQDTVAERMAVTQGTIAHWIKGRREINLKDFFTFCEKAGAEPSRILFGDEPASLMADLNRFLAEHPALQRDIAQPAVPPIVAAAALPTAPQRRPRAKVKPRKVATK